MKLFARSLLLICAVLPCPAVTMAQRPAPAPPKKTGAQPVPTPEPTAPALTPAKAAEPFEGAGVDRMAAQCVTLETEAGPVVLEMLPHAAPETVRNFLNLAATGAFETTTFSRVVPSFVVQGGNLRTREQLTPELAERSRRTVPDEPNEIKHVRGVVSMARSDEPNSATTNFFILVGEAAHLDGKFAAFARVRSGMEAVDAINSAPVEGEKPVKPVRLNRAVVAACAPATNPEEK